MISTSRDAHGHSWNLVLLHDRLHRFVYGALDCIVPVGRVTDAYRGARDKECGRQNDYGYMFHSDIHQASMTIIIAPFQPEYTAGIAELVLGIQQNEFGIPITLEDQPDLSDYQRVLSTGFRKFLGSGLRRASRWYDCAFGYRQRPRRVAEDVCSS
jgi:hypothetical protein